MALEPLAPLGLPKGVAAEGQIEEERKKKEEKEEEVKLVMEEDEEEGEEGGAMEGEEGVSQECQVGLTRPPHRHISGLHYDVRMARNH